MIYLAMAGGGGLPTAKRQSAFVPSTVSFQSKPEEKKTI